MNNSQVARVWANKSKDSANGSNFYFIGDIIYSYGNHFPIARHINNVILLTTKSYSYSTAKHINEVKKQLFIKLFLMFPMFLLILKHLIKKIMNTTKIYLLKIIN